MTARTFHDEVMTLVGSAVVLAAGRCPAERVGEVFATLGADLRNAVVSEDVCRVRCVVADLLTDTDAAAYDCESGGEGDAR